MSACPACLRRAWLVGLLAPNLELAWRGRRPLKDILALEDAALVAALAGRRRAATGAAYEAFSARQARAACAAAAITPVCRHDERYPARLRTGPGAPAVLYVAGDPRRLSRLVGGDVDDGPPAAAVVGTRRASPEALQVATTLGRGLAVAGVTVVSGMALGIDSAAHEGALDAGGPTLAVLACGPERAYPARKLALHRRLVAEQLVVSELPPGTPPWRWSFPARNRIIAALGRVTLVVEAAERSGSLITADFAADLGRDVAAVPGRAWSPRTRGSNALLGQGAAVVLGVEDALDAVLGLDRADVPCSAAARLPDGLARVLDAVTAGADVPAPGADGAQVGAALAALAELEGLGLVRRAPGGRYVATAPGWRPLASTPRPAGDGPRRPGGDHLGCCS
jgi:DNA processing protein